MKAQIINPEVVENLYKSHGQFACVCYNTPQERAENVGKLCQQTGHMSGSRCEYIKFLVTGIDRGTAEQCLRHEIGTWLPPEQYDQYSFSELSDLLIDVNPAAIVKNMASFRYIDKTGFQYETPRAIKNAPEAKKRYDGLMEFIRGTRSDIVALLVQAGCSEKAANEAANMVLPRATLTEFVIGFTPEALIHFCHKRLCNRAQEFIHDLAKQIKAEVEKHNPRFANELVPHCEYLLYCPEGKMCCGKALTRSETADLLNAFKAVARKEQTRNEVSPTA